MAHKKVSKSPSASSKAKIPCQLVTTDTAPPKTGAQMGATALTAASITMKRVRLLPKNMSVAMLFDITMPPAPAIPWKSLAMLKMRILLEKMQSSEAAVKSSIEATRMCFRPYLSVRGPMQICPPASPIIPIVRLMEIKDGDV